MNGTEVSGFNVLDTPVSAQFAPHSRNATLAIIPMWYVTLKFDKTYPGGINGIGVSIWADNGQIGYVQMLSI